MESEEFQNLMLDQFAKLIKEFQELKGGFQGLRGEFQDLRGEFKELKNSQTRMENKFDEQIVALHDFRVSQEQSNQANKDAHITFNAKIEELQFGTRITDQKLDDIAEDVSYLARKSFRQERQIKNLNMKPF